MINSLNQTTTPLYPSRLLFNSSCGVVLWSGSAILNFRKFLYISFFFWTLWGCVSVSKKIPLHSKNLSFKIQWNYSSPVSKPSSLLSVISIQGSSLLRLDILQPFVGAIGRLIVNQDTMILQAVLQKTYYQGEFDSKVFFPDFPSFPSYWLTALLRVKAPENWDCQRQRGLLIFCRADQFEMEWKYKKAQLYQIHLKDSSGRQIQARIKNLSSPEFSSGTFNPSLKNWSRQKDPRFFQKL